MRPLARPNAFRYETFHASSPSPRSRALEARAPPRPPWMRTRCTSDFARATIRLSPPSHSPLASPRYPSRPSLIALPVPPFPPQSKSSRRLNAKRPDDDGFYDAETPEEFAKRKADAQSRIAGIEAMLKEQAAQLEASKAEAEASVAQLRQVMSEKNTVERIEEMERKKEAAEIESERMRDENNTLLDTVTVLTDARAATTRRTPSPSASGATLVAYQEKTPTEFLAEIVAPRVRHG